jgi:AAA ATPase-like protein
MITDTLRPPPPFPPRLEPSLSAALEKAAVLGAFRPRALIEGSGDKEAQHLLLGALASVCDDLPGEEGVWRLVPDAREQLLRDLAAKGSLRETAASAKSLVEDGFGRFLIGVIEGRAVAAEHLNSQDLSDLHSALSFAKDVVPDAQSPEDIEQLVTTRDFDEAIDFLLPPKLVGRRQAVAQLRRFVQRPPEEFGDPMPIAVVSGIGGAGKSAVLAQFVRQERRRSLRGAAVIWLDFDRASLASADSMDLTMEFSRQLARSLPRLAAPMAEFRRSLRGSEDRSKEQASFEGSASVESETWSLWQWALREHLPLAEPVALILDTFEEILLRDELELEHVLLWIASLQKEAGITVLRPILSGRGIPEDLPFPSLFAAPERLDIGDLPPAPGAELLADQLEALGQDSQIFSPLALVQRFGGNPLLLRILARYCAAQGPEAAGELLAEGGQSRFESEFAQAFLYTRILQRIRSEDPLVKRLAHPGLVLRRITPDLICEVLADPCGLGAIDHSRAEELFDNLSKQVWLVDPIPGQRAVRHRRDLRRLMMRTMANVPESPIARIHAAAHEYYYERRDRWMSADAQHTEGLYHFYMTGQRERLPDPIARAFLREVGQDVEDLPAGPRADLKLYAGRSLTREEAEALEPDLRERYESEQLKKRVHRGTRGAESASGPVPDERPAQVVDVALPAAHPARSVSGEERDRDSTFAPLLEARFAEGDFAWMRDAFEPAFAEFARLLIDGIGPRNTPSDLTQLPLWRVTLASLPEPGFAERLGNRLVNTKPRRWSMPMVRGRRVSAAAAVTALLALVRRPPPPWLPRTELLARGALRSTDELRILQLVGPDRARRQSLLSVNPELLTYLAPASLGLLRTGLAGPWFGQLARFFEAIRAERRITLADIRRFRSGQMLAQFPVEPKHPDLAVVGRGMTPEIYPPVRAALYPWQASQFAIEMERRHLLWPAELSGARLDDALQRDPQRWLATLVECADRFGELGELIDHTARGGAVGTGLRAVWEAYDGRLRAGPDAVLE